MATSSYNQGAEKTYMAEVAIAQHLRVKAGTAANQVDLAGAEDDFYGTALRLAAADEAVAVRFWKDASSFICVAATAIVAGADVYGAAGGKVDDTGTTKIGVAQHAAAADGDFVTVVRDTASL